MKLDFNLLAQKAGIVYAAGAIPQVLDDARRHSIAMDSNLVTAANGGIPALFTQWVDPHVIEVLVTPMKMAEIFSEIKKGDWVSTSAIFPMIENTGEVSTYGDFNENGNSGANVNFPSRQPYHYQTNVRVGEKELEIMGAAKLDWASKKQASAALTLNKFQNKSYILGIAGLENYGVLNDPGLLPATPQAVWDTLDGQGVFDAISKLVGQLIKQADGHIDQQTSMKLIMSPTMSLNLNKTNQFNVNVTDQLAKNFPNLSVHTVPEYSAAAGEHVQLIVEEYQGQKTVDLGFTEKMRVHSMIQLKSGWEQKRSQGTWGAIVYRPLFVVTAIVS